MQGRTAGDLANAGLRFLSSRKAARAERYTPNTTVAELSVADVWWQFFNLSNFPLFHGVKE